MPSRAAEFLIRLSENLKLRERFRRHPQEVMAEAGLSAEDRAALGSGEPAKVRERLGSEGFPGACVMLF